MILIDSHCHINDEKLLQKSDEIIAEARQAGVGLFIVPAWDFKSSIDALSLTRKYPGVYAAIGYHPENIEDAHEEALDDIKELAKDSKVIAIGEIGLDYHWYKNKEDQERQKRWFIKQIEIANELNLPVSIHAREAAKDTLDILRKHPLKAGGVLHCYSGSCETLLEFAKLGLYFGFDGPITYKNSLTPKANVAICPIDRMLSETDSPYLPPEPHRGEENHPAYVKEVVKEMAEIRGTSVEEIAEIILQNTKRLFHVEP